MRKLMKSLLLLTLIASTAWSKGYSFSATEKAPADKAVVEAQENDWFVTNKKAQDQVDLLLYQNSLCMKELDKPNFFSPTFVIGGIVISFGVGVGMGLMVYRLTR